MLATSQKKRGYITLWIALYIRANIDTFIVNIKVFWYMH